MSIPEVRNRVVFALFDANDLAGERVYLDMRGFVGIQKCIFFVGEGFHINKGVSLAYDASTVYSNEFVQRPAWVVSA